MNAEIPQRQFNTIESVLSSSLIMEYLRLPLDYRLRSLIHRVRSIGISKAVGTQVQILRKFGDSLP
jgi:hypothetical protein